MFWSNTASCSYTVRKLYLRHETLTKGLHSNHRSEFLTTLFPSSSISVMMRAPRKPAPITATLNVSSSFQEAHAMLTSSHLLLQPRDRHVPILNQKNKALQANVCNAPAFGCRNGGRYRATRAAGAITAANMKPQPQPPPPPPAPCYAC